MTTVVKSTSKGQITLPIRWRRNFATNRYIIEEKKDRLEIRPLDIKKLKEMGEYTVFDAIRDNRGRGIKAKDLVKILEKTI
jgi:bifunctional DNA-binding transcriptional regulator/antitoxin component of YhaV-PrlF toxin-antitoxin module